MFRLAGFLIGFASVVVMLIALVPLLGWLNWINIPAAAVGLIFSSIGRSGGGKTMCAVAIIVGVVRLWMGHGIF